MLTRWDPFRDLYSMRRSMDRMMEDLLGTEGAQPFNYNLPLDVSENDDEYIVKASLPGVKPEDVDLTYSNGTVTIHGETEQEHGGKDEKYHLRERTYGAFSRTITLPAPVNGDKIEAHFENGVLTVRLPKTEEVKPKRIPVHGEEQKAIEGSFSVKK